MENCVFCRIARKESPASIIYEEEKTIAFLDIQPVNAGHSLVIPRSHATELRDLSEEDGAHMFRIAMRVSEAIDRFGRSYGVKPDRKELEKTATRIRENQR